MLKYVCFSMSSVMTKIYSEKKIWKHFSPQKLSKTSLMRWISVWLVTCCIDWREAMLIWTMMNTSCILITLVRWSLWVAMSSQHTALLLPDFFSECLNMMKPGSFNTTKGVGQQWMPLYIINHSSSHDVKSTSNLRCICLSNLTDRTVGYWSLSVLYTHIQALLKHLRLYYSFLIEA